MAKTAITNVAPTNTFQVWLDKTNELVNLVKSDIMTASSTANGDITQGNATLEGNFTATNINVNTLLRVDSISPKSGSTSITVLDAPLNITNNQTVLSTLTSTVGPRIGFTDTAATWQVGFENVVNKNFAISAVGVGSVLTLTSAGALTVNTSITAPSFNGNLSGNLIGDVYASNGTTKVLENGTGTGAVFTGSVTGTVSSLSNHTTANLAEGANQYFTTARARNAISGTGLISYDPATGVVSITSATVRAQLSQGTGVTYNSTTGVISIGQPVATTNNVTFANLSTTGTIASTGAISSQSEITAFASSSDIRKKENIVRIENALDKVTQIGGYTYNFKGDTRKITGVIAQEIEKVLPEVVYEIEDEDFGSNTKAVRYGNIVGLLIEAIKELKAQVDELKG